VNSKYEQRLSMDELMEMNRRQPMRQPEPEQKEATPIPIPSIEIHCPLPEEMERLEQYLHSLKNLNAQQEIYLRELSEMRAWLPTRMQIDELLAAVKHLEEMTAQAGKKKEKHFSLPRLRLPRLHLPDWDGPTVVTVVMALVTALLLLVWFKSGGDWSNLSSLLP